MHRPRAGRQQREHADREPAVGAGSEPGDGTLRPEQRAVRQGLHRQRGEQQTTTKAHTARQHRLARAAAFHPLPKHSRRDAEQRECDRVGHADIGFAPVTGDGSGDPKGFGQRLLEDTEAIDLPDAHVDRDGRGRDKPPVETRSGDSGSAIKKTHARRSERMNSAIQ